MAALAQRAGLALPVVDLDRATVRYSDMFALIADLRAMGATNALDARSRTPLRREVLARAAALYAERFADPDGRLRATFDIVWLAGWAPHESQPKPLEPGSATMRLADALKRRAADAFQLRRCEWSAGRPERALGAPLAGRSDRPVRATPHSTSARPTQAEGAIGSASATAPPTTPMSGTM